MAAGLMLLCLLPSLTGKALAEGREDRRNKISIWARTEEPTSGVSKESELPSDALVLTVNGETQPVGFLLRNEPYADYGTVFYVEGRNLEKYFFISGYILHGPGGALVRDITQAELDALNNGEALEFTMEDYEFTMCFVFDFRENITPTPTPSPTPTPEPTPEPEEVEPEPDNSAGTILWMFLGMFLILAAIIVFVFLLVR